MGQPTGRVESPRSTPCAQGDRLSTLPLSSPETIRQLADEYAGLVKDPDKYYHRWCVRLAEHLEAVAKASLERRAAREFQKQLWDDDVIAATGQGNISVDKALADDGFRQWLAARSLEPLPEAAGDRTAHLQQLFTELRDRVRPLAQRTPRLKIFRVLASFHPFSFTTVADAGRLERLHRAMLPNENATEVERHQAILRRLDEVLGPVPHDLPQWVVRMTFPWRLVEVLSQGEVAVRPDAGSSPALQPLPAARRRRGMTAMKGYVDTVLRVLDFVGEGIARDDLYDFLKQENPSLKTNSIGAIINVLRGELAVLERSGDRLVPTDLGRRLLAEEDPFVLAPLLVTRTLGVDHALVHLRDRGPTSGQELARAVQGANPGWTSLFAPQAILSWLRSFGAIHTDSDGRQALTPRGKQWAALIHWTPESYRGETDVEDDFLVRDRAGAAGTYEVPPLAEVLEFLPEHLHFAREQVAALHAGLWSHPRRHFAILSGLSGSGKTSLAREYAKAIQKATPGPDDPTCRVLTVPVSPGWTDPSALLGYLNPLRADEYLATSFARFLVSCDAHPSVIHVAVLDEMNLSHPEQYLAPLLSGMELEDEPLVFHHEEVPVDGIPGQLDRYPPNLVLIGTVNMDETTHGVSDKVLDRALTLEFWNINLDAYPRWGTRGLAAADESRVRAVLTDLMNALAPVRLHFGWRIVDDVLAFLQRTQEDGALDLEASLDWIVYSKILPKLRGYDSPQFRKTFELCGAELEKHSLPRARAKMSELLRDLQETGSARFWR
jgi:5-methylcytosine-specific restriction enzyme B